MKSSILDTTLVALKFGEKDSWVTWPKEFDDIPFYKMFSMSQPDAAPSQGMFICTLTRTGLKRLMVKLKRMFNYHLRFFFFHFYYIYHKKTIDLLKVKYLFLLN